jgi:hypothetical protein
LVEDLLHFVEHLSAAELGDDEVVGKEGVVEGLLGIRVRVRVSEELESEGGVLFEAEEGGEPEGRDGFWRFHFFGLLGWNVRQRERERVLCGR